MSGYKYQPPYLRNILLGILAALVLMMAFGNLDDIVKWAGRPFLYIPSKMGLVEVVTSAEVIPVSFASTPTTVTFPRAGSYAFHTNDYDLLVITDALIAAKGEPWLVIKSPEGRRISVAFISRGLMPYDTPYAKGRPIYTFEIPSAGDYEISHPHSPSTVYFVPDYVTGSEGAIRTAYYVQLLVIAGLLGAIFYRRYQIRQKTLRSSQEEKRAASDELVKKMQRRKSDHNQ